MKKTLVLSILIVLGAVAFAQNASAISRPRPAPIVPPQPIDDPNPPIQSAS